MLWKGKKKIAQMWVGNKSVAKMWRGATLIFGRGISYLGSCFGSGVWLPEKPWIGTDKWKMNK